MITEAPVLIKRFVFSIMAKLIVEMFSCCSPFISLCNGLKISEYDVYWLTDFSLINIWECAKREF